MSPQEYQKFKQSLKETQERSARMIERMDKTLEGVRETISQIQENQKNIDNMKKYFGEVMEKLAYKLAGQLQGNPLKKVPGKTYTHLPQAKSLQDVVKIMLAQKNILIITGAGVSAPSGIPTFRGTNGLYSKKFEFEGQEYEPEEFITNAFYQKHPIPIWQWIQQIYKMSTTLKPNKIHELLHQLAKELAARGKQVTLVTQNVDDLHLKPAKKQYAYYAVHGNVKQVRCENNHLHPYADYRKQILAKAERVQCPICHKPLRPHVLFFDQSYGPLYGGEVKDQKYPFVIVVGSSLSTGLCIKLTASGEQVVQINPEPVIEVGKVFQFSKDTVQTLQGFLKTLKEKK